VCGNSGHRMKRRPEKSKETVQKLKEENIIKPRCVLELDLLLQPDQTHFPKFMHIYIQSNSVRMS
jgi:hypothetical protein